MLGMSCEYLSSSPEKPDEKYAHSCDGCVYPDFMQFVEHTSNHAAGTISSHSDGERYAQGFAGLQLGHCRQL